MKSLEEIVEANKPKPGRDTCGICGEDNPNWIYILGSEEKHCCSCVHIAIKDRDKRIAELEDDVFQAQKRKTNN